MPNVAFTGTYPTCRATARHREAGGDGGAAAHQQRQFAMDQNDQYDRAAGNQHGVAGLDGEGHRDLDSVSHQHKPVDVGAEIDDSFTEIELFRYEDLGFAERFGGYKLVEADVTSDVDAPPVNPGWRLQARGRPPGARGVAQCVELTAQIRGEAAHQVDGARVALAHNIGGPTAVSAVTILKGSANGAG